MSCAGYLSWLLLASGVLQTPPQGYLDPNSLLKKAGLEREAGRRAEAIDLYRKLLAIPKPVGPFALKAFCSVTSKAQWELANCLEAEQNYGDAVAAYRDSARNRRVTIGGGGKDDFFAITQVGQGRCLESLGRHEEAIQAYFKAADFPGAVRRIADLYEAAGHTDSLKRVLARREPPSQRPDHPIRLLIEVREEARLEQWTKLVERLLARTLVSPYGMYGGRDQDLGEAAQLLADRPEKAVPLLKERLASMAVQPGDVERNGPLWNLGFALNQSEAGRKVLAKVIGSSPDHVKRTFEDAIRWPRVPPASDAGFPAIPKGLRLDRPEFELSLITPAPPSPEDKTPGDPVDPAVPKNYDRRDPAVLAEILLWGGDLLVRFPTPEWGPHRVEELNAKGSIKRRITLQEKEFFDKFELWQEALACQAAQRKGDQGPDKK